MTIAVPAPGLEAARKKKVWTTFIDGDKYLPGLIVLAHSLRVVKSCYEMVIMVTEGVSQQGVELIKAFGLVVLEINPIKISEERRNKSIPDAFSHYNNCWTKLRCFELDQYERVVFLDSDMLVQKNMDELMDLHLEPGFIGACHTCVCRTIQVKPHMAHWEKRDCGYSRYQDGQPRPPSFYAAVGEHFLNSGLLVVTPSKKTFENMIEIVCSDSIVSTFWTVEQDFLAYVFRHRWTPLHWKYNCLKRMWQDHPEIYQEEEVCNIHYILSPKPWERRVTPGEEFEHINKIWWKVYDDLAAVWEGDDRWETMKKLVAPSVAA